jgi:hypothetical protein
LDRNRLRRATLVPGFRDSWAASFPCCGGASGSRRNATWRPAATRPATRQATRKATAQTPPGGDNGAAEAFWRCLRAGNPTATQCGPGCHSGSAKYARSVQQPHGDGRSRGPTGWKSDGGERTFTRGDTVGGQQEQRIGAPAQSAVGRSIPGNRPPGPAHLSLPEAAGSSCSVRQASFPPCLSTHMRQARHHAPAALPPTAPR